MSEENLNHLAIESGFKVRESKISPKIFIDSLLFNASSEIKKSLNNLSIEIKQNFNVDVSKQGLNDRYTEKAANYLKDVLTQFCFALKKPIDEGWLGLFNNIRIKDSTKFVLPEEYAKEMKGFGGVSSKSATCIQYEFDLKTGSMLDLDITPANRPDSTDASETKDNINLNDLVIRDLGYYSTKVLEYFIKQGAFLISKLNVKTLVYEMKKEKYVQINFGKLYEWMSKNKLTQIEKQVYIGLETKLPVRLIIDLVPDEVFNQRMLKVNKYNKRKGYKTSDEYAHRSRFNLIITNIPLDNIPAQAIIALYHTRWQIELIFKIWKSTFGIHKIGKMKFYRWLSNLYAKLILIAIYWQTILENRSHLYKAKGKLLSLDKCFKTLKDKTQNLREAIRQEDKEIFVQFMVSIIETISDKHWLEKKKNKLNFEQTIYLLYCKSNIYVYI